MVMRDERFEVLCIDSWDFAGAQTCEDSKEARIIVINSLKKRDRFLGAICPINYELPSSELLLFGCVRLNTGMHRNTIKWIAFRLAKPHL